MTAGPYFAPVAREDLERVCAATDPTAAVVWVGLLSFAWNKGGAYPSLATLAGIVHLDRRTVQRALRRLEAAGILVRAARHHEETGAQSSNRWEVSCGDAPQEPSDSHPPPRHLRRPPRVTCAAPPASPAPPPPASPAPPLEEIPSEEIPLRGGTESQEAAQTTLPAVEPPPSRRPTRHRPKAEPTPALGDLLGAYRAAMARVRGDTRAEVTAADAAAARRLLAARGPDDAARAVEAFVRDDWFAGRGGWPLRVLTPARATGYLARPAATSRAAVNDQWAGAVSGEVDLGGRREQG